MPHIITETSYKSVTNEDNNIRRILRDDGHVEFDFDLTNSSLKLAEAFIDTDADGATVNELYNIANRRVNEISLGTIYRIIKDWTLQGVVESFWSVSTCGPDPKTPPSRYHRLTTSGRKVMSVAIERKKQALAERVTHLDYILEKLGASMAH